MTVVMIETSDQVIRKHLTDTWIEALVPQPTSPLEIPMSMKLTLAQSLGDVRVRDGVLHYIVDSYENSTYGNSTNHLHNNMYTVQTVRAVVDKFLASKSDYVSMAPLHTIEAICQWMLGLDHLAMRSIELAFEHEEHYNLATLVEMGIETGLPVGEFTKTVLELTREDCMEGTY